MSSISLVILSGTRSVFALKEPLLGITTGLTITAVSSSPMGDFALSFSDPHWAQDTFLSHDLGRVSGVCYVSAPPLIGL